MMSGVVSTDPKCAVAIAQQNRNVVSYVIYQGNVAFSIMIIITDGQRN